MCSYSYLCILPLTNVFFLLLDGLVAGEKLWADMEKAGLVLEVKPHMQRVPRSQRGGEVIEPLVSTQWFVRTQGMAQKGIDAVRNGDMKIIPERFEKTWFYWLENIRDWCVSRQLWWGHRIPVWHVEGCSSYYVFFLLLMWWGRRIPVWHVEGSSSY
jgi:valyl-tRNA synthetase